MTLQSPIDPSSGRNGSLAAAPEKRRAGGKAPRRPGAIELPLLLVVIGAGLSYAWMQRETGAITAETGLGYYLGIIGGVTMLMLLAYPLRKRLGILRSAGNVRGWFRLHMILGLVGPAAIILHSNFTLGSLNSSSALMSMLLVAGSGLVGRFLYSRIHRGLYGRRETLREQIAEIELQRMRWRSGFDDSISDELAAYQEKRLDTVSSFWGSFATAMSGPVSHTRFRRQLMRRFRRDHRGDIHAKAELRVLSRVLDRYFTLLGRAEAFRLYERMFAAWHMLHLPLFLILVVAATVHVVAVHLY